MYGAPIHVKCVPEDSGMQSLGDSEQMVTMVASGGRTRWLKSEREGIFVFYLVTALLMYPN